MRTDYIPRPNEAFESFFKNLTEYVASKTSLATPVWTNIPNDAKFALLEAYMAWHAAFAVTQGPHTSVQTNERNRIRLEAERILRTFVNRFLRFPPVTDMDRDAMGIPNRDLIRTPHIEVTETVEFELRLHGIREIIVNFWIKGSTHRAKPSGYDGAVIVWDVLDEPPARPEDLTQHTMASKTPHTLTFDETQRGKTVYIACAWQNERGNIGSWSEIQSAVIP